MAYLHVYYGDGAGKSSAATGAALRALGHGMRVIVVRFLKPVPSGEDVVLSGLRGVEVLRPDGAHKFLWQMSEGEKVQLAAQQNALFAYAVAQDVDLLVLDEAIDAAEHGVLDAAALAAWVRDVRTETILTGHRMPAFCAGAGYITQFTSQAHPFSAGVSARAGVEY